MRELHVLGVSDEGDTVLLGTTADGKITHRLALDDRLRQAVRGQLTAPGGDRAESALSPKEIQARLRAGATPEEVAKAAGVPVARVLPFFAPVEAERLRIVDEARLAMLHRARGPEGVHPLGDLVDARLREVTGLKEESVAWTARRRGDGTWVVGVTYVARGGRRRAEWLWKPAGREVTALDSLATRMASEPAAVPARRRKPAAAKKAVAPRKAARKAAPARKRAAAKKAVAPVKKAAPVRKKAAPAKRVAAAKPPVPRKRVLKVVPDPVEVAAEPGGKRRAGERVPLPSWSDVLLGVGAAPAAAGEPSRRGRPRRRRT